MRLCTYTPRLPEVGISEPRLGVIWDDGLILDVQKAVKALGVQEKEIPKEALQTLPGEVLAFLDNSESNMQALKQVLDFVSTMEKRHLQKDGLVLGLDEARLMAPVPRPRKILAALVNTRALYGGPDEIRMKHPRLFIKASNIVIGPNDVILAPPYGIRPEVELAAIMGKKLSKATVKEAEDAIFGYTIFNDVTAPKELLEDSYEAYRRDQSTGQIRKVTIRAPFFRYKNHDTFAPMGPWIVTRGQLPDVSDLKMTTRFNGELIQSGSTSDFIFTLAEIAAFASTFITIEPGDIIASGTVAWTASPHSLSDPSEWVLPLTEGTLELEIEGIGVLRNYVKFIRS